MSTVIAGDRDILKSYTSEVVCRTPGDSNEPLRLFPLLVRVRDDVLVRLWRHDGLVVGDGLADHIFYAREERVEARVLHYGLVGDGLVESRVLLVHQEDMGSIERVGLERLLGRLGGFPRRRTLCGG